MEPSRKITPQFFFLSVTLLVSLVATAASFLSLVFATLDKVFPDVLTASYTYGYSSYSFDTMRSAVAILIIAFPVLLTALRFWNKAVQQEQSHWDTLLKKWVLYLIFFLTSVLIVVDLITLIRYFVSGELTVRFGLKVVATLIVGALIGWYYIVLLRGKAFSGYYRLFALWKSTALVVAAIVWAFVVMGGPGEQRKLRLDQRRIDDLQSLQSQIITYWQQKETLPVSLSELSQPLLQYNIPQDPEFTKGKQYEYKKINNTTFSLCATFDRPLPQGFVEGGAYSSRDSVSSAPYSGGGAQSWVHDAGYACFDRTIDPAIYPPFPKASK